MKKIIYLLALVAISWSCSSPKYTASFPNYDKSYATSSTSSKLVAPKQIEVNPQELVASTSEAPVVVAPAPVAEVRKSDAVKITKDQRKQIKAEIKKELKNYIKAKKSMSVNATEAQGMDKDLKFSLIFFIAGIIGYWILWPIGVILTCIGLYFLIKWLIRQ